MEHYLFSTMCDNADSFLNETLNKLSNKEITTTCAIQNLKMVESYSDSREAFFVDADLTKETKNDFIEAMSKIANVSEDSVWNIYDQVYNETII